MKLFLKGFGKGLLLLTAIIVLSMLLEFAGLSEEQNTAITYLLGAGLTIFFIVKYKFMKAYALLALLLGGFMLPFVFGAYEMKKVAKRKK